MTIGIYLGAPKNTDKVYIGQSINIEDRIVRHNAKLRNNTHTTKMLEAFKEFGEFEWEIIEECAIDELDDKEEYYIKLFNSVDNGFNSYRYVYEAPPAYKGILNSNVKYEDIPLYKAILDYTIKNPTHSINKIVEVLNCSKYVVDHLWQGGYSWLKEIYPEEYNTVRKLSGTRQMGGKSLVQQGKSPVTLISPELDIYIVDNIRKFARDHILDCGDLNNLINKKVGSTKKWIVKDLDISDPEMHNKFYSTNRGYYKKQFDLYKSSL